MIRLGLDAMGGDHAPQAIVKGAVAALKELGGDCRVVLYGDRDRIEEVLREENTSPELFDIVHTTEVIGFDDSPSQAFVKKPGSSIAVGFSHLKTGKIDGFASAGSTGAMLVGSMLTVKQTEGVIRPTIAAVVNNVMGGPLMLLDVGLNVDSRADVLYQWGIIGSLYINHVMGVENPRVALLNIGEEREKGDLTARAAHELMASGDDFNFVGNIEGKDIFTGRVADVIVCDGFVGNAVLKQAEGFYSILKKNGVKDGFVDSLNYELYGGTPILGVNGAVVVGHGRSTPLAIKNMVLQTEKMAKADIGVRIKEAFSHIAPKL